MGDRANAWLRSVLWDDLIMSGLSPQRILGVLDISTRERQLALLELPSVQRMLSAATELPPADRKRLQRILRGLALGTPGAPRKALRDHKDVEVVREVESLEAQLADGFGLFRRLKRQGGYESDPEVIVPRLRDMGYTFDECAAIIQAKSARGAAQQLLASRTERTPGSIRSMAARGRKKLST